MKNILVRAPNWIGDQVLAFPFFHYLRKAYPDARIASVCVEWVGDLQYRDLVDEVHTLPRVATGSLFERMGALKEASSGLRKLGPWDLGISLPNSLSSAWLLRRSDVRRRRGYKADGRGLLLNDGIPWDPSPQRHRAQAYVDLLPEEARPREGVSSFWGTLAENDLDEGIPGELPRFDWTRSWPGFKQIEPPAFPYWVLAPGATADSRRWPVEHWIQLARRIHAQTGWMGVVVGSPTEAPLAVRLCEDEETHLIDMTARGPIPMLARIFSRSKVTVTNESGLAHVAALCGSFVQIVCGAADPRRTTPLGPGRVQVAVNPVECWPCERNVCMNPPETKFQCLRGIQPDAVWEEILLGIRKQQATAS